MSLRWPSMSLRWPSVILLMLRMHTEYLVSGEEFQTCWLPVYLKQQLCMLQQYQPHLKSLLYNCGNGGSVTAEHGFGSDPLEAYAELQCLREHDFFHRYPCFWKHPSWWWCPLQRSSTVFCITNKCLFTACMIDAQPDHLSFILHVRTIWICNCYSCEFSTEERTMHTAINISGYCHAVLDT